MKIFKKSLFLLVALFLAVFTLASCNNDEKILSELEEAAKKIVLTQDKQEVTGDFDVTAVVKVGENSYNVAWASDNAVAVVGTVKENFIPITIDYLHNQTAATKVKLTATVSKDGSDVTFSKDFNFTVPQFKVNSIAEYDALNAKENVTVHGIIVAKETYGASYKNTSVYLASADGIGGVYAYRLACTEEQYNNELKIGQKIFVSGPKYVFNGLREFDGGCTYILDTDPIVTPTVTDITAFVKDGSIKTKDVQNQLVKFENLEIVSIGEKDSKGRYNIVCGDETNNITVRVNTYITTNDSDAYKAYEALNLLPGMLIDVKGVAGYHNATQIHPLDAGDIVVKGQNYAKGFAAALAGKVNVEDAIYGISDINLPTTLSDAGLEGADYAGLTASWTSESANVVINGNVATTKLVAEDTTATLKVTIKDADNNVKATATVEIKLTSKEEILYKVSAPKADTEYVYAINFNGMYYPTGKMSSFYGETTEDASKAVKVKATAAADGGYYFSTTVDGATKYLSATASGTHLNFTYENNPTSVFTWNKTHKCFTTKIGDDLVYIGFRGTYKTIGAYKVADLSNGEALHFYEIVEVTDAMRVEMCLDAVKKAISSDSYEKTAEVLLKLPYRHAVLEVTLPTDAKTLVWDAAASKLTITPLEALNTEKLTVKVTVGEVSDTVEIDVVSELLKEVSVTEALELEDGKKIAVTGEVKKIDSKWNGSNCSITITDGTNDYYVYKLATNVLLGATVKITGVTGSHNGNKQVAAGATAVVISGSAFIPQVYDMADNVEVVVSGTVSKINGEWSDQYNNMNVTITDGSKTLYVFRLATKVALGDDITVTGKVGSFNGSKQIAAGATAVVDKTAEAKAEEVAAEVAKLFTDAAIPTTKKIELDPIYDGVKFTVTPQANATTLAWDAEKNILTVTPGTTEVSETVTIVVTLGDSSKEATYTVKSLLSTTGLTATITYTAGTTTNMDGTNQAELLGLDATIFSVVGAKGSQNNNVGLNKDGSIRMYATKETGDGNTLTITATGVKITKIIVTYGSKLGTFTVNGTAGSKDVTEYTINGTEVVIKNTDTAGTQVHFTSIQIVYDIVE